MSESKAAILARAHATVLEAIARLGDATQTFLEAVEPGMKERLAASRACAEALRKIAASGGMADADEAHSPCEWCGQYSEHDDDCPVAIALPALAQARAAGVLS